MNKRGLSEIIAYVLLVVIALSLSLLVYAWMKNYLPKEGEKCPDGVSLIISGYRCNPNVNEFNLTLKNKGLFNLYGFVARIKNSSDGFYIDLKEGGSREIYFFEENDNLLRPNNKSLKIFNYENYSQILEIRIEPFIEGDKKVILCENAVITQKIEGCN